MNALQLDDELKDSPATVSLIKIDTEEDELHVLGGAARVPANHRPVLVPALSDHV